MASTVKTLTFFFLLYTALLIIPETSAVSSNSSNNTLNTHLASIKSVCKDTPYPDLCFNSLKLTISITINPNILTYLLKTLETAISEATKLNTLLLTSARSRTVTEHQKGTLQDCRELHQITISALKRSLSNKKLSDTATFLSAALTNKDTCLEGLTSASGPGKPGLVNSVVDTYKHVSNSLSILSQSGRRPGSSGRRLISSFPKWVGEKDRRILEGPDGEEYDPSDVITVSADGTGNFTTLGDAVRFAPNNSYDRTIIYVTAGVYAENVEIPSNKTNIVLLGDGADVTVVTGNRSVVDGWTTFRSATVAVSGEGFLARDITFENTAGPEKHQAVAFRANADYTALYRCAFNAYQDTLYVHSFRQFYRECDISGTIDYIFGNAAVVFQGCNIISRMPLPGQFTVVTAQSRGTPDENTGISIQNCTIFPTDDLNSSSVKNFLGRPWQNYSRTVILESYIDGFIDPNGWTRWSGDQGLDTLYYGEYYNYGPGSGTDDRVTWPGYHVMDYYDAYNFTVSEFITSDEWLDSTSFPYDDEI